MALTPRKLPLGHFPASYSQAISPVRPDWADAAETLLDPPISVNTPSSTQASTPVLLTPPATPVPVAIEVCPVIHGTHEVPFKACINYNTETKCSDHYQSIVAQSPYLNACFEELRFVDYWNGLQFAGGRMGDDLDTVAQPGNQDGDAIAKASNAGRSSNVISDHAKDMTDGEKLAAQFTECLRTLDLHARPTQKTGFDEEIKTTPLFKWPINLLSPASAVIAQTRYEQYSVIGSELARSEQDTLDKRAIFLNTNAPWSAFLCGSQGSGKSYTLSCMLENCLMSSIRIGKTPKPLAGIVFAYDAHSSGTACEAACLASHVPVNVLVSPSNHRQMKALYEALPGTQGRINVQPLFLNQNNLNTQRMLKLMAFSGGDAPVPLYMEVIINILKEMAMDIAATGTGFNYALFLQKIQEQRFDGGQKGPMALRLLLLDSFMNTGSLAKKFAGPGKTGVATQDLFKAKSGSLTIVDLTDPFVDAASACVLFDICLALFLEDRSGVGKVVALDEAHKFMTESGSSAAFTESLLTVIREQRHKGLRMIIATQEPTISPKLLDLCSMTFVHRFTSPEWLSMLQKHLAGASKLTREPGDKGQGARDLFDEIVNLNVGESLLFSPSAMLDMEDGAPKKLGMDHVRFKTRMRLTSDGGKSVMAT